MEKYTFSIVLHSRDDNAQNYEMTWDEWVKVFSKHELLGAPEDINASEKHHRKVKNHTAVILGPLDGKGKSDVNMLSIQAMSLDLDDSTEEQISGILLNVLKPFEFVAYTTHKHGADVSKGLPRVRVILPLAEPHAPEVHKEYWHRLNALIGHRNDKTTKNPARLNFLPSTFDPKLAESFHNKGEFFAPSTLPAVPQASPGAPATLSGFVDAAETMGSLLRKVRKRLDKDDPRKQALINLLTGKDYAEGGKGHIVLLSCINYLSTFGKMPEDHFRTIFSASIEAHAANSKTPETVDMAWQDYSARHDTIAAQRQVGAGRPYTDEDYTRIGEPQGLSRRDELRERWILQSGPSVWFLNEHGEYQGPYTKDDHMLQMKRHLSRVTELMHPATPTAPPRMKSFGEVAYAHATPLEEVRANLALQANRLVFESQGAVLEYAMKPMRTDLTPHFDQEIDDWLRLMCGPTYNKVIDWLSVYMELDEFLCAIYIAGPQGCGKTLFAQGIAKLWTTGPATILKKVMGNFNAGLEKCPVLLGDEDIRKTGIHVTAEIRELLGNPARTFEKKYQNPTDLGGHVRIVLAANDDRMLRDNETKTKDALEAIALRFLFIQPSQEATTFLKFKVSKAKKHYWGEQGLARHALWLREHHTIANPGDRFVVEGDLSSMTTGLAMSEDYPNFVCETLVKYLQEPDRLLSSQGFGRIFKKDGELLAMPSGVQEAWDVYLKRTHLLPETRPISETLKTMSLSRKQVRSPGLDSPRYFFVVNPEYLIKWSEECGEMDRAEILELMGKDSTGRSDDNVIRIHDDGSAPDTSGENY